jgi:hypothetical protein
MGLFGSTTPDAAKIEREAETLGHYLEHKRAERFPKTDTDAARDENIASGKAVFDRECASCHAEDSARVGRVLPLRERRGGGPAFLAGVRWLLSQQFGNRESHNQTFRCPAVAGGSDGRWRRAKALTVLAIAEPPTRFAALVARPFPRVLPIAPAPENWHFNTSRR